MPNDRSTPEPETAPQQETGGGCQQEPCSASSEPLHVYDWIESPATNDAERDAKEWLDQFTRPAYRKDTEWLARYRVTVEWKGRRYTCSGASRMGDVWLKTEGSSNFYDHRVNVEELSNWKRNILPNSSIRNARESEILEKPTKNQPTP